MIFLKRISFKNIINIRLFLSVILYFFALFFLFFSKDKVFAEENFRTYINVVYKVLENGNARISQEISLVNLKPNIYISEYLFSFSGGAIENVSGWDRLGPLKIKVESKGDSTDVTLSFNEKIVGKDQNLSFVLSYEIPQFSKKDGQVWKIFIPKLNQENIPEDYSLQIIIPDSFGALAFSSPNTMKKEKLGKTTKYFFEKKHLLTNGALMEFGDFQIYDFKLLYNLANAKNSPILKEITLPPDTQYQIIEYQKIDPAPENIIRDGDGNWLAQFYLLPKSKVEIEAVGKVKIFPFPINLQLNDNADFAQLIKKSKYWEIDDEEIIKIAKSHDDPKKIYDFVVKTLNYNYDLVDSNRKRFGALQSLKNSTNCLCLEFTDLFVAIARAAGIPAREIEGFAYTDNPKLRPLSLVQDILHSWPEYYDKASSSWKMIDPTWGKTTGGFDYFNNFDMSHFTFVIHGLDSQLPFPAGSFKLSQEGGKNVFVNYGTQSPGSEEKISVEFFVTPFQIFSKKTTGYVNVKNLGTKALYNLTFKINDEKDLKFSQTNGEFGYLLPFGSINVPIDVLTVKPFYKDIEKKIEIIINGKAYPVALSIKFINVRSIIAIGFSLVFVSIIVLLSAILCLKRSFFKKKI